MWDLVILMQTAGQVVPTATSIWENPIVIGGMITVGLALVTAMSSVLTNAQAARREAAAELRVAAIKAKEKKEDYDRQDEVARRAEVAAANVAKVATDAAATAKLLLASQIETTARQDEVAAKVATAAEQAATAADLLLKQQESSTARQDEVAARVEVAAKQASEAAELLRVATADSVQRTEEVARLAAQSDILVQQALIEIGAQGKLSAEQIAKIHTLVNSEMTAARTAERNAMAMLVTALKLVLAANKKLEIPVSQDLLDQVDLAGRRVQELDQILKERHEAQAKMDAEAAARAVQASAEPADTGALKKVIENAATAVRNTEKVIEDAAKIVNGTSKPKTDK